MPKKRMPEGFVGYDGVAAHLKATTRTIRSWKRRGFIPWCRIGGAICFNLDEVDEHLYRTCRVAPRGCGN